MPIHAETHESAAKLFHEAGQRAELAPIVGKVKKTIDAAREVALEGKIFSPDAESRIETAISTEFAFYALEAEVIAAAVTSPEYTKFIEHKNRYFEFARVGAIQCPDGRIISLSFANPRGTSVYRKLRGMPRTEPAFRNGQPVPVNPVITASIEASLHQTRDDGWQPLLVEFVGPHIFSTQPTHGCGAAAGELSGAGSGLPITEQSMRDGGLRRFFEQAEAAHAYDAFNNVARLAGGVGVTYDMTHDATRQSLIFGLRRHYGDFRSRDTLRNNLLHLHEKGQIVLSEVLADELESDIIRLAHAMDPTFDVHNRKNIHDFLNFRDNAILIGAVGLELTKAAEDKGFDAIPEHLQRDVPLNAIRVLAYHLYRNAAYQIIAGIKADDHPLIHHPERVLRVGTIGADFNVKTIPFVLGTADLMTETDISDAFALYQLMGRFLPEQGVDLEKTARIIMITGSHNPDIYNNQRSAEFALVNTEMNVRQNAKGMRQILSAAEQEGYAVILPIVHHTVDRSLRVVVKR